MGGLVAVGAIESVKQSVQRRYRYPAQETKLRVGKKPTVPAPEGLAVVTITDLDRAWREVVLKVGKARAELLADRLTLHPEKPIGTDVLAEAMRDVIADQCGAVRYRAVDDLLSRAEPRLGGDGPIMQGDDPVAGMVAAVRRMEGTVLPVQGPPGTGKTHVTARAILSLVREGFRVGVTSNSHEAIRNVLMGCLNAMEDADLPLTLDMVHKVSGEEDGYPDGVAIRRTTDNAEAAAGRQVVGGTAYFFAREENVQAFDWLFVDEAGQVGLANMAAMGRAARNIVLVGDPRHAEDC